MITADATLTLTDAVFGKAQFPAAGVKVNTIAPLNPAGLNELPDTPFPVQLPLTPLCVVLSETGASILHKAAGGAALMTTAKAVVTLTVAVLGKAQFPAAGVKVRTTAPLNPAGLNVFPATPLPLQLPDTPL